LKLNKTKNSGGCEVLWLTAKKSKEENMTYKNIRISLQKEMKVVKHMYRIILHFFKKIQIFCLISKIMRMKREKILNLVVLKDSIGKSLNDSNRFFKSQCSETKKRQVWR
jgi:hypothetical protein